MPFTPVLGNSVALIQSGKKEEPPFYPLQAACRAEYGKVYYSCFGPMFRLNCLDPVYLADVLGRKSKSYSKPAVRRFFGFLFLFLAFI